MQIDKLALAYAVTMSALVFFKCDLLNKLHYIKKCRWLCCCYL